MLQAIQDKHKLRRLQKERRKIDREWTERVRASDREGGFTPTVRREHALIREQIDYEISRHITEVLRNQAEYYFIPFPEYDDETSWQDNGDQRMPTLSPKGVLEVRSAIRKERKEAWEFWAGRLTTATGLIGALIGLVAVFKK
ncbi:hypothetical protein [Methylobacterium sp. NFXW15]|uniref:hypothetical protein n=1 Tax=Methylobacterium sp. NFXW15 TaxID=2819512 RepID=UPI003CF67769